MNNKEVFTVNIITTVLSTTDLEYGTAYKEPGFRVQVQSKTTDYATFSGSDLQSAIRTALIQSKIQSVPGTNIAFIEDKGQLKEIVLQFISLNN